MLTCSDYTGCFYAQAVLCREETTDARRGRRAGGVSGPTWEKAPSRVEFSSFRHLYVRPSTQTLSCQACAEVPRKGRKGHRGLKRLPDLSARTVWWPRLFQAPGAFINEHPDPCSFFLQVHGLSFLDGSQSEVLLRPRALASWPPSRETPPTETCPVGAQSQGRRGRGACFSSLQPQHHRPGGLQWAGGDPHQVPTVASHRWSLFSRELWWGAGERGELPPFPWPVATGWEPHDELLAAVRSPQRYHFQCRLTQVDASNVSSEPSPVSVSTVKQVPENEWHKSTQTEHSQPGKRKTA